MNITLFVFMVALCNRADHYIFIVLLGLVFMGRLSAKRSPVCPAKWNAIFGRPFV